MSLGLAEINRSKKSAASGGQVGSDTVQGLGNLRESGEHAAGPKEAAAPQPQPAVSVACEIVDPVLQDGLDFQEKLKVQVF